MLKLALKRAMCALRSSVILSLPNLQAPDFTEFFHDIKSSHSHHFPYPNKLLVIESSVYKRKMLSLGFGSVHIKIHKRIMNNMNVSRAGHIFFL